MLRVCVCVCVCLIYIDAITPSLCHAFLPRHEGEREKKAYSTPFSVMKMTKYIIHSKSAILRWIYALCITSCLLSDAGACDAYSQPARQSVVQTKWFGLAGSRGADNGRTVWLKCLWCQWLCQQLRLADPKWRSAESPAGACHGLNRGSFDPFFFPFLGGGEGVVGRVGSFQSRGAGEGGSNAVSYCSG